MDSPSDDWRPAQTTPTPRSETLPRNFSFHHSDSQRLRTPEPSGSSEAHVEPPEPPQPPKLRIKRRRPAGNSMEMQMHSEAAPVPTIELSESHQIAQPPTFDATEHSYGYLAPALSTFPGRSITPPTTPLSRISHIFQNTPSGTSEWSQNNRIRSGNSIVRPSSTWSEMSDSSNSSHSSAGASYGESCTSPESEADPFVFHESLLKTPSLASPLQMHSKRFGETRPVSTPKLKWTPELDKHLWDTYLTYLADPTVTPFKLLPGTAPPLGVCYRVARKAKATWKGPRVSLDTIMEDGQNIRVASNPLPRFRREASAPLIPKKESDSPDTIVPTDMIRSHSSAEMSPRVFVKWPRSASTTRRRLRELCKKKPTLPPHYQRLMQNRSPSPFESSSSQPKSQTPRLNSPPSRSDADSNFATRDMNLSLATSISSTMQPDGPLTQITSEVQTPRQNIDSVLDPPSARFSAHQKSQSLQLGLGLGSGSRIEDFRRLASPFQEGTLRAQPGSSSTLGNEDVQMDDARPKLQSPLEIHAPRPLSGSMKRRAQYQLGEEMFSEDADTRRNFLEGMFRDNASGKRRVRSRGFSMGAVSHGPPTRPLAEVFIPPPSYEQETPIVSQQEQTQIPQITATAAPQEASPTLTNDLARRLGSPFAPIAHNPGFSNTFPRSLFPQGLDTIANLEQQSQDPFAPNAPR